MTETQCFKEIEDTKFNIIHPYNENMEETNVFGDQTRFFKLLFANNCKDYVFDFKKYHTSEDNQIKYIKEKFKPRMIISPLSIEFSIDKDGNKITKAIIKFINLKNPDNQGQIKEIKIKLKEKNMKMGSYGLIKHNNQIYSYCVDEEDTIHVSGVMGWETTEKKHVIDHFGRIIADINKELRGKCKDDGADGLYHERMGMCLGPYLEESKLAIKGDRVEINVSPYMPIYYKGEVTGREWEDNIITLDEGYDKFTADDGEGNVKLYGKGGRNIMDKHCCYDYPNGIAKRSSDMAIRIGSLYPEIRLVLNGIEYNPRYNYWDWAPPILFTLFSKTAKEIRNERKKEVKKWRKRGYTDFWKAMVEEEKKEYHANNKGGRRTRGKLRAKFRHKSRKKRRKSRRRKRRRKNLKKRTKRRR